jgi:hypothetical protein
MAKLGLALAAWDYKRLRNGFGPMKRILKSPAPTVGMTILRNKRKDIKKQIRKRFQRQ